VALGELLRGSDVEDDEILRWIGLEAGTGLNRDQADPRGVGLGGV